jgi:small-conductance mechanosensitive channel
VEKSYEEALREIKKVGDVITIQDLKGLIKK